MCVVGVGCCNASDTNISVDFYVDNNNFLASINKLLSTDGISLDKGSFIYSTSGLNDGFTD